ncbi:MAG TPA: NAD(P)(+) transhydrogenase (Re/Si-specific) subunit beta, partial [Pseudolysinimonas sp.]|nr:NAD(P)(+) transhydrogenase (Re/Si-specific) subunit beta [Pseudolysinimonas sp.]
MTATAWIAGIAYLIAAVGFVVGLHLMRTPSSARRGNLISAGGMALAIVVTVVVVAIGGTGTWIGWGCLIVGLAAGSVFGAVRARTVKMTDIPQLVSLFNAVGGGAAAVVAIADLLRRAGSGLGPDATVPIVLDVLIGSITLSGSLIAAGKLQGMIPGRPLMFPGSRVVNVLVVVVALGAAVGTVILPGAVAFVVVLMLAALAFGVLMVLPIGGADAPVVVSLLNAFTGLAVAMAGFVIGNQAMIIAGALVGAAGTILTLQMAAAMNRSV